METHTAGQSLDEASLRALLASSRFVDPEAPLERIGEGWDCDVYRVGDDRVVRVARNAEAAAGLARESTLLPALAPGLPLTVPTPLYVAPEGAYSVSAWIRGRALCELEIEAEDYDLLAPTLGEFLQALHRLPLSSGLPGDTLRRLDPTQRSSTARQMLDQLSWEGAFTRRQRARLDDALDEAERRTLSATLVAVHGDLHPCNLLIDEDGFTGVIDWIDLHAGHPAVDLASAYLSLPRSARAALFAAYGGVDPDTLAWARWRAITTLTATVRGAMARGWGLRSHAAVRRLSDLAVG